MQAGGDSKKPLSSTPKSPLIVGGAQPEGYLYVGLNQGTTVLGHVDIVAASITLDDEEQAKHT